jgi:thioredoxin 1
MSEKLHYLDDSNFDTTVAEGVTLVDFYADWCGPCRMITPIIEELASEMEGDVKIAKLDIESAQNTTSKLQVTSIPTIIVFKDGKEVQRVIGVQDIDSIRRMIDNAR